MGFILTSILLWFGLLLARSQPNIKYLISAAFLFIGSLFNSIYFYGYVRGIIVVITLFFAVGFIQAVLRPKGQNIRD